MRQITKQTRWVLLSLTLSLGLNTNAFGQAFSFTAGDLDHTENFDGMGSAGSTFITGWTSTDATMFPTTGTANSGGIYNVGSSGDSDRAFGSIASGSLSPVFGASFTNSTGSEITQIDFTGVMEQWRSGSNSSDDEILPFEYSLNATSLTSGTWVSISGMDLLEKLTSTTSAGAVDGNDAANKTSISGSSTSISWANGTTVWIRWSDTDNSGSDGIYTIDDFSMTVVLATTGSSTLFAGSTSEPTTISSLVNILGASAVNFDFAFTEGDAALAQISDIVFTQGLGNDVADWTEVIEGVQLSDGLTTAIGTISTTDITFASLPNGSGQIGEITASTAKTYELQVWLKNPLTGSHDGDNLVFEVNNSSFTFDAGGLAASQSINSGATNNEITVIGTEMRISGEPASVTISTDFALTVSATDANGNIDTDAVNSVTLSRGTGAGVLSSATGLSQSLSSGVFSWSDLQNNTVEIFDIATTSGLTDDVSSSINAVAGPVLPTPNITQDFEGTATDGWGVTSGFTSSTTNSGTPSGERIRGGVRSFQSSNTTSTLDFEPIDVSSYTGVTVEVWSASISTTTGNGIEGADEVRIYLSESASFSATPDITINGVSNTRYGMSGTGNVTTTAGTPVTFSYPSGGTKTGSDAKSQLLINVPDAWSTVYLRVETQNNSTSEVWCLDDVGITGTFVPTGSSTLAAGGTTEPVAISSLVNTLGASAVNFDFAFTEGDAALAQISDIVFTQGLGNDVSDWTEVIEGAQLSDGSTTATATIGATGITFASLPNGAGQIGEITASTTKTYELQVWLKNPLTGSHDGDNLVFEINNSGLTLDAGALAALQSVNSGTNNEITVIATEMRISGEPLSTPLSTDFALTVSGTDANGNIDTDAVNSVTLARGTGTGILSSATGLSQSLSSGVFSWSDLQYNTIETFDITTTSGLTDDVSNSINVTLEPYLIAFQSFESLPTDTWTYTADPTPGIFVAADDEWNIVGNLGTLSNVPSDGANFFGGTDIDNGNNPNGDFGTLTFATVNVSGFVNTSLSFDYEVDGFDTGDDIDYEVTINGVGQGAVKLIDGVSNLDANGTETIAIPDGSTSASIIITITQNGTDYVGIDNFKITGESIVWNGAAWNNGSGPTISDDAVLVDNYTASTNGGGFSVDNLYVNDSTFTIDGSDVITVAGNLANSGSIIIQDNGALVQTVSVPSNSGTGTYTLNRVGDDYHGIYNYWSSPVTDATIGAVFPTSNSKSRYSFDAAGQAWVGVGNATVMAPGVGYIATGKSSPATTITRIFTSTAGFNSGSINASMSFSGDGDADNDWNLIGNPYPSGLSANAFLTDNTGEIDNAIYLWNSGGSDYSGEDTDYATMNASGVTGAGGGVAPTSNNVSSGQGFFVSSLTGNDVIFNNSQRGSTNNTFVKLNQTDWQRLWLGVNVNNQYSNEILVGFMPDAEEGYSKYDAKKFKGSSHLALYSLLKDNELAIQGLPSLEEDRVLPIGLDAEDEGKYTFDLNHLDNFSDEFDILLHDAETDALTDLKTGNYSIDLAKGTYTDRFTLRFIGSKVTDLPEDLFSSNFSIYAKDKVLHIQSLKSETGEIAVAIYDLSGRKTFQYDGEYQGALSAKILTSGVFIVKIETQDGIFTEKIFVK